MTETPRIRVFHILDYVSLELTKKSGEVHHILLDEEDYQTLQDHGLYVEWRSVSKKFYAIATDSTGKRQLVHRLITDAKPDEVVHHVHADFTTDNRREFLQRLDLQTHSRFHRELQKQQKEAPNAA